MSESAAIELHYRGFTCCCDGSSTRSVVQKCKLAESLTRDIVLEVSGLSLSCKHFCALERTFLKHIHAVTLVALSNHDITILKAHLLNSIKYDR